MKKNKITSFILALFISLASFGFAYEYEATVVMKDGTVFEHNGSTASPEYQNHFGHDPNEIEHETVTVYPWDNY